MRLHQTSVLRFWSLVGCTKPRSNFLQACQAFRLLLCTAWPLPSALPTFLLAFWMVSLHSSFSWSIRVHASHSSFVLEFWLLVCTFLSFSFFWAALPILVHTSSHTWSGLVVVWTSVSLPTGRHVSFERFSLSMRMKYVNPIHESDKLLFSSTFQSSSMRLSCTEWTLLRQYTSVE